MNMAGEKNTSQNQRVGMDEIREHSRRTLVHDVEIALGLSSLPRATSLPITPSPSPPTPLPLVHQQTRRVVVLSNSEYEIYQRDLLDAESIIERNACDEIPPSPLRSGPRPSARRVPQHSASIPLDIAHFVEGIILPGLSIEDRHHMSALIDTVGEEPVYRVIVDEHRRIERLDRLDGIKPPRKSDTPPPREYTPPRIEYTLPRRQYTPPPTEYTLSLGSTISADREREVSDLEQGVQVSRQTEEGQPEARLCVSPFRRCLSWTYKHKGWILVGTLCIIAVVSIALIIIQRTRANS